MSGFNQHPWAFWILSGLAIIAAVGGAGAVLIFLIGLALHFFGHKDRTQVDQSGFEVKLIAGMTPGLFEKKEDHHG